MKRHDSVMIYQGHAGLSRHEHRSGLSSSPPNTIREHTMHVCLLDKNRSHSLKGFAGSPALDPPISGKDLELLSK